MNLEILEKGMLELFDVEDQNIGVESRLLGGMSNFTYRVKNIPIGFQERMQKIL